VVVAVVLVEIVDQLLDQVDQAVVDQVETVKLALLQLQEQ
tara:strand:+ start:401 stop:520 length:120 start_codon:yes stop_codon:yes gene_type:complete